MIEDIVSHHLCIYSHNKAHHKPETRFPKNRQNTTMPPPPLTTIDLPAIKTRSWTLKTTYTISDIISYNLALGAPGSSLPLVYEAHPNFHALPTYGAVPCIAIMGLVHASMHDFLPNFKGHAHVHGEHYLRLRTAYPVPEGNGQVELETTARVVDIVARLTGVLVCVDIVTREEGSRDVIYARTSGRVS